MDAHVPGLDDRAAIRRLIEIYAHGCDRREPALVAALFAPDGALRIFEDPAGVPRARAGPHRPRRDRGRARRPYALHGHVARARAVADRRRRRRRHQRDLLHGPPHDRRARRLPPRPRPGDPLPRPLPTRGRSLAHRGTPAAARLERRPAGDRGRAAPAVATAVNAG